MLWSLLVGCVILRVDGGAVAAFDPELPAQPQGAATVGVGTGLGAGLVSLNLESRPSATGFEVAFGPEGCIRSHFHDVQWALGGCLGVTLIGGGVRDDKRAVLFGGPRADVHSLFHLADLERGQVNLRLGARGGLDVRTLGTSPSPFVGGYAGIEIWWLAWAGEE